MEENKQLVREALAAFGKAQYEDFLSYFSDDFELSLGGDVLNVNRVVGIEAWRETLRKGFSGNPDEGFTGLVGPIRFEIDQLIAEGDYVVDVSRGYGYTTEGHREYNNHYCRVWEIRDGKVVSLMEFLDTALFNRVVLQLQP